MYPENPQHLMRNFRESTSKPYGYLLIDLKPFIPENKRLHCNPFQQVTDPPRKMDYSRNTPQTMDQSTRLERDPLIQSVMNLVPMQTCSDKAHNSCKHCGLLFQTKLWSYT